jgi:hypothetical protein
MQLPAHLDAWATRSRRAHGLVLASAAILPLVLNNPGNELVRGEPLPMMQLNPAILVLSFDEAQRIYSQ